VLREAAFAESKDLAFRASISEVSLQLCEPVILSAADASRSEASAESKDPYPSPQEIPQIFFHHCDIQPLLHPHAARNSRLQGLDVRHASPGNLVAPAAHPMRVWDRRDICGTGPKKGHLGWPKAFGPLLGVITSVYDGWDENEMRIGKGK